MTPRALLTAIAATAIGFALVLSTLATSAVVAPVASDTTRAPDRLERSVHHRPLMRNRVAPCADP